MKRFTIILCIIIVAIVLCTSLYFIILRFYGDESNSNSSEEFCKFKNLCKNKPHIACNNDGKIKCDGEIISMSQEFQDTIVKRHNELRNEIASGVDSKFNKASKMATITWDKELAYLAELNVKTCQFQHDCHNTDKYPYSGQNLASFGSTDPNVNMKNEIINAIDRWYNEKNDASMDIIKEYPNNYNGPAIGHFTAIIHEKNFKIGCAIIKIKTENMYMHTMACNYSYTNMIGEPIYQTTDKKSGNECETGTNSEFEALCSVNEKYNVK